MVIIINQEVKADSGDLYLTFKMLKRRYRCSDENSKRRNMDYFNHPFEVGNEIKLIDDVDLDKSLSIESLATQFEPTVQNKRGNTNAVERDVEPSKKKKKKVQSVDDFSAFDPDNSTYY